MIIVPIPKLNVKKACPSASTILDGVRAENCGLKRTVKPSLTPSSVTPLTAKTAKIAIIRGIIIFDPSSIPDLTPLIIIPMQKDININCHMIGLMLLLIKLLNISPDAPGLPDNPSKPPVNEKIVYKSYGVVKLTHSAVLSLKTHGYDIFL